MKRKLSAAGTVFLLIVSVAQFVAQTPPAAEPPSRWVPFTAKMFETHSTWRRGTEVGGGHYEVVQVAGEYARNGSGATYERWLSALSPTVNLPNIAVLTDRPARAKWEIDYKLKNVRRSDLELKGHPELAAFPMTWQIFLKRHAKDTPLGHKTVSGVECVEYRIHDPETRLKMYRAEVCFAPSLNFLAIKYHRMYPEGRDVTVRLENIQLGVPDPDLFHIPAGFSRLH
jgi:hypothetical protein